MSLNRFLQPREQAATTERQTSQPHQQTSQGGDSSATIGGSASRQSPMALREAEATESGENSSQRIPEEEYDLGYMERTLSGDRHLWDMRCWDRFHDREEVLRFLEKFREGDLSLNSGHCCMLIGLAKFHYKVPLETIAGWMLDNPFRSFGARLVPCWRNPMACPRFAAQGNFGNNICEQCHKSDKE